MQSIMSRYVGIRNMDAILGAWLKPDSWFQYDPDNHDRMLEVYDRCEIALRHVRRALADPAVRGLRNEAFGAVYGYRYQQSLRTRVNRGLAVCIQELNALKRRLAIDLARWRRKHGYTYSQMSRMTSVRSADPGGFYQLYAPSGDGGEY
jgi:hypothetical protein